MALRTRAALLAAVAARKRGYTLSEVMITVLIMGILAGTSAPIMVRVTNFWRQTTARANIERDVRISLETINRWLRQAQRKTVKIDQVTGQPPFSRISFSSMKSQSVTFYQDGSKLYQVVSSGTVTTTSLLSNNVGYIAFVYPRTDDISIVSVAMTMQAPTYLGGKKALQLSIQKVRVMN